MPISWPHLFLLALPDTAAPDAPPRTLPAIASVQVSKTSLAGGNSLLVAVTLTAQTPLGGSAVSLTYSDQTVHSNAQKGLTIPQGQSSGSFALSTIATATSITVTVTGSLGASAANATFTVRSPQPRRRTQRRVLADGDGNRFR